jgi:ketosteroid isomerase-like protein
MYNLWCMRVKLNTLPLMVALAAIPSWSFAKVNDIGVADAEELLQHWRAAQNHGDFTTYQGLYAEHFTGIRRSGARVVPMNRKRWMDDRAKMFAKPMKVQAEDLHVVPGDASAIVTFTQIWSSKTYKDQGRKQMVLVRGSDGQLKIAQEVMLDSRIAHHDTKAANDHLDFAFMFGPYVVLPGEASADWADGAPTLISVENNIAAAPAQETKLPAWAKKWKGHQVRVYKEDGSFCTGTIGPLAIVATVIPHFGEKRQWTGGPTDDGTMEPKLSDGDIARAIWKEGDYYLAARPDMQENGCQGAQWAQSASLPMWSITNAQPLKGAARQLILDDYIAHFPAAAPIVNGISDDSVVIVQSFPTSKGEYVTVNISGGNYCSDEDVKEYSAVGRRTVSGTGAKVQWLANIGQMTRFRQVILGAALNDAPWFTYESFPAEWGALQLSNGSFQLLQKLTIPYHDCPC